MVAELDRRGRGCWRSHPQFEAVLGSALVSHEEKVRDARPRRSAASVSPLVLDFLKVLPGTAGWTSCRTDRRRKSQQLYDELRGRVRVEVHTATPLDERPVAVPRGVAPPHSGRRAQCDPAVDPSLIGGVVLRVGDTVYDGSVARQLDQVREQMINRSVHEIQSRRDRFRHSGGN